MSAFVELKPGQAQFFSSFQPSLTPGDYLVKVTQEVSPDGKNPTTLFTDKNFKVQGPSEYRLPAGSIHSIYPGEGESVPSKVLPQITLSDPHIPWELSPDDNQAIANQHLDGSLIPWVALLVFEEKEIETFPTIEARPEPSSTLSLRLSKKQLQELKTSSDPVPSPIQVPLSSQGLDTDANDGANLIFVNSSAFRAYFSKQMGDTEHEPAIARYSYLSHIRRSRSTKPRDSTTDTFSIVLGHRSGPLEIESPTTAYAHLVSLMGVSKLSMPGESVLTGLVSLYSWSFKWTKGNDGEIKNVIEQASKNVRPLARILEPSTDQWLRRRLEAGYTMAKHRTQTGEQTAALFRGPLIPQRPRGDELDSAEASGHGSGLQIIDKTTGIIDITYSAAWSLGRSLAIENSSFTMAISALRTKIAQLQRKGSSAAFSGGNSQVSQDATPPSWYEKLKQISQGKADSKALLAAETGSRWKKAVREKSPESKINTAMSSSSEETYGNPVSEFLEKEVDILVDDKVWYARELVEPTQEGLYLAKVLDFVYNQLLTLQAVPHNYMFPEPDILDTEAIFTFHIDPLWLDTLVDGALSIGSHSTVSEDCTRNQIKWAINLYLQKVELKYRQPRIPRWGVIICGTLLKTFDDPRVRTGISEAPSPEFLVNKKLSDRALLLILNCRPNDLPSGLTISQAPHQQRFAVGKVLEPNRIEIEPVGVLPENLSTKIDAVKVPAIIQELGSSTVFNFVTGCLNPSKIMEIYVPAAKSEGGDYAATGSSALLSFVLGDKIQELSIKATKDPSNADRELPLQPFQLSHKSRVGDSKIMNLTKLKPSTGSIKLGFRVFDEKEKVSAARPMITESSAKASLLTASTTTSIQEASPYTHASTITTSCRVLKKHSLDSGTRVVDLIVTLEPTQAEPLSGDNFQGINVSFPLTELVDTKAVTPPKVTLFGQDSARWVSGSAYVTGDKPCFTVKLRLRAPGLAKKVNFGFLLSNVVLSDHISDDVLVGVEEEYGSERHNLSGAGSQARLVRQTCSIGGLKMDD
ncbi:uncharacterized protein FSUBG_10944 [Fusarium subglutinans]|uniref:Uncharacterized protein n=1 Tax=Gibberella subglutinans TaxID=42677 RepID=A0A8H5P410_GIBSU|nr:uncharacterized protein FSUBG_10944 [Fusarium subglutinans]KAF5590106.1 hypothetical protein FSUBG_10944 [Fusarium subglutinans]